MRVHTVSGTPVLNSVRHRRRIGWMLTTALVGTFGAGAVNAELPGNYAIPVNNVPATNPVVRVSDTDGALPNIVVNAGDVPSTSYETMGIELNRAITVMNWGTFNLTNSAQGNASAINYTSTVGAASVLNRVAAGNPTTIQGAISAPNNVAVWLINTSGITVGAGGNFSGGSLVLSASDIAPADFGNAAMNLTGVDTAAPINLTGAGDFTAANSIIVVGQQITANKNMSAGTGEVALIAARDLTLPIALGSPLAITVTRGTNLGTASVNVGGTISGQSVRVVGASEGGVIASLLNVSPSGTLTANAANGVIVLATTSDVATGVSITGAAGNDGITVGGTGLTASGATADIAIRASGAAAINTVATAGDRVDISGRSVSANAGTVSLTSAAASAGDVSLTSSVGDVSVDTADAIGGNVVINSASNVTGRAAGGPAGLTATGAGENNVTVGAGGNTLLGTVTAEDAVSITAGTITSTAATNVTAGTSLSLNQLSGDLTFPGAGAYVWGTDLALSAAQDLLLAAPVLSPGSATLNAGRDVIGASVATTNGNIAISAGRNIEGPAASRMAVTAGGVGRTVNVTGTTGRALLGSVTSDGTTDVTNAVVDIASANIVLNSATSTAGALTLNATAGGVAINTATANGGNLQVFATDFVRGRLVGSGADLTSTGASSDIFVSAAGAVNLTTPDSSGRLNILGNSVTMTAADAEADLVVESATTAVLGNLTTRASVAVRAGTSIAGGTIQAGEDIAILAGTTVNFGASALTAGDDIDITAAGAVTAGVLTANGTGVDTRSIDLTAPVISFNAETPDHVRANIRATSTTASVALGGTNSNFVGGGDIAIDAATSVALTGTHDSGRSLGILAQGGGVTATGALTASEDLGIQAAGAIQLTTATGGDDVSISGTQVTLTEALADASGSDTRTISFGGPGVTFLAGELPATVGSNLNVVASADDIVAGALLAVNNVTVTANRHVRADVVSSLAGNITLGATTGSVTGQLRATPGASDPTFGRTVVSAAAATRNIDITAAGLVQLGTATAGNNLTVTAGNAGANGAIDITAAAATAGALSLTAQAVPPVVGVLDGDIILGTGIAGTTATLTNTATGGTRGDVRIGTSLTGGGSVIVQSAANILMREFVGGAAGVVRSNTGNITLTAADSIFGLTGTATMPLDRGFGSADVGGNLNVLGLGDFRIDSLSAGGNIFLDIAGSLTGRAPGSIGTAVSGGALFAANGNINVTAGNTAGDVAVLNTIEAGGDISVSADGMAIGTFRSTAGTLAAAPGLGGFYFGRVSVLGDLTISDGGVTAPVNPVTQTLIFDPGFGVTNMSAGGSITSAPAGIGGIAQLGTVTAGTDIALTARGIAANSVTSTAGPVALTASVGTLAVNTLTSGSTATLTKQLGNIGTAGDEVRILTSLSATGDATVLSDTHVRVATLTSDTGNVSVTATNGDVSGLVRGVAATDGRLLAGFDRANLTASAVDRTVTVSAVGATAGNVQLGTVNAGTGLTTLVGDQITVDARTIDVSSATAFNGNLTLSSTFGDIVLGSGTGGVDATLTAEANAVIGDLTARTGDLFTQAITGDVTLVTGTGALEALVFANNNIRIGDLTANTSDITLGATNGDISGLARTVAATDGRLLAGFDRANLTSSGVDSLISVTALGAASGSVQLGTVNAGAGLTTLLGDQITVNASAIDIASATAFNGNLNLTSFVGDIALVSGTGGVDATVFAFDDAFVGDLTARTGNLSVQTIFGDVILTRGESAINSDIFAARNVRIGDLTANTGNVGVSAFDGSVSGLARTVAATDGRLLTGFDRANITASAVDSSVGVTALGASGNIQLGTVIAGTGDPSAIGLQLAIFADQSMDITTATAANGDMDLFATSGDIVLGSGMAGTSAFLSSAANIRIGDLTARAGDISVTAGGDISGLARLAPTLPATDGRLLTGFDRATLTALAVDRSVTVGATTGTVQLGAVNAGTGLSTFVGDQVTVNGQAIDITNATAFNGSIALTSTVGDVILGTGNSGVDARILAESDARIGDLTARTGNILVTTTTGDVSGLARTADATDGRLLAGFDRANLTAFAVDRTVSVSALGAAAGNAQLGSVNAGSPVTTFAGDQIIITAQAIDITSATAFNGNLRVTSSARDVVLGSGRGGVDAIITAASSARIGLLRAQTRDLFVDAVNVDAILVDGNSARNSTVTARENVRIGMLDTFDGNVSVTATRGDVSGLVRTAAATDGRLLAGFDRGIVTAGGVGRTTTVSAPGLPATGGNVQLGIVRAGSGLMTLAGDQVTVIAQAIDIGSTTADNGNLVLISTARDVVIGDGTGRANATVQAAGNARIGNLTALTGDVLVTAATGDVSGLADAGVPLDGRPLPGFGRTNLTASDVGRTVTVSALDTTAGNVQLGTVNAGFGVTSLAADQVIVNGRAIDITSATALNGNLALISTARDVVLGTGFAGANANVQAAANVRIGDLVAQTGDISVAAVTGNVSGLSLATPAMDDRLLLGFDRANLTARAAGETVTVSAVNGTVQLGAVTAGAGSSGMVGNQVTVTGQAIDITSAMATNGNLVANATLGALKLQLGSTGASAQLTKTGLVDEVSVANLLAGMRNGGIGAASITSSTNIRANFVTARGGDVTLRAIDGEVTGRLGTRAQLTAGRARDIVGTDIESSDRSILVSSGRLALLGSLVAGESISVDAGIASAATRQGRIDLSTADAARGSVSLTNFNSVMGSGTDIIFNIVSADTFATMFTDGINGGDVIGNMVFARGNFGPGDVVINAKRDAIVTENGARRSIAVQAGRRIVGDAYTAGEDVFATAVDTLNLGSALAGDDIYLNGSAITLGTAVARGNGPDTSSVDFAPFPNIFVAERADRANANITIGSTTGDVTVNGPLSAQRNVTVSAARDANIRDTVTAGAPVNPGDPVILGNYSVTGGTGVNLGTGGVATTHMATGAVTIRAMAGNVNNLATALTIQANSDGVGAMANGVVTEPLAIVADAGNIQLGNTNLLGGTLAGRQSEIALTAANGAVTFARADGNALIVRAGGTVTATDAITAGNGMRVADPVSGFNTVDILSTGGSIGVTTIDAIGTGHDILLVANGGALTADRLTADRNVAGSAGSVLVNSATATNGALGLTAGGGNVILGSGGAGGNASLLASQNVRVGTVLSGGGNISVTATNGDVSGFARTVAATDGRLLAGFDRADLTASGIGRTVSVSALSGTVQLGSINAGTGTTTSAGDQISVTARAIDVTTANAANGGLLMDATAGDVILVTGTSGVNATLRASSDVRVGDLTARTGDVSVTATMGDVSGLVRAGAATDGRLLAGFDRANLTASAAGESITVSAVAGTVQLGAASAGTGTSTSVGDQLRVDAQAIDVTTATAANGNLLLTSTLGDVILGTGVGGVDASVVAAANARIGSLTARTQDLSVRSVAGDTILTTGNSGRNATVLANSNARIGDLTAAGGDVSVTATTGAVSGLARMGAATDGRLLSGFDRANLTASGAGETVVVSAVAGPVQLGAVNAGAGASGLGADQVRVGALIIDISSVTANNGRLVLDATAGDVILGTSTSRESTSISARDVVRLGPVTANASPIMITASDAVLNGDITGSAITVMNRSPSTTNVFRLGDGVAGTGFSLDQTEVNRLNAAAVTLNAGTGAGNTAQDIAIGELAIDTSTGSSTIDILGTRRIDVTGTVRADGSAATRVIRFGGSATATDKASVIRVAPLNTTGGGRISMASANVELRGVKIGVGQDPAFLAALGLTAGGTPLDPATVATDFINNPVSTLYSAANGGTPYNPLNQEIFAARTLTVKFTDYALFQNTGAPGTSGGVALGGTLTAPLTGTILDIAGPNPPDARGFAIFGSINGVTGQPAALLGGNTVAVLAVDRANTRINGCIVGSGGGGCLVNVITQPVLSVFDSSKADIFQTAADFEIPFDPVVGTNNESLFGDVGTFGLDDIPIAPLPACDADKDPACTRTQD